MGLFSNLSFLKRTQAEQATPATSPEATAPEVEAVPAPAAPESMPEEVAAVPTAAPQTAPAISSQQRAEAEKLVRSVVQEVPDFIAVAVVDGASGHIMAGKWAGHSGGAVEAAVANAEIVRQVHMAITALELNPTEQLEDILITLNRQLHVLRLMPSQQALLYLAVRTQDTNLALVRTVLRTLAE